MYEEKRDKCQFNALYHKENSEACSLHVQTHTLIFFIQLIYEFYDSLNSVRNCEVLVDLDIIFIYYFGNYSFNISIRKNFNKFTLQLLIRFQWYLYPNAFQI